MGVYNCQVSEMYMDPMCVWYVIVSSSPVESDSNHLQTTVFLFLSVSQPQGSPHPRGPG